MSTAGLPTIWELVADGAATLPEPFSRAALINWVSARRPEVGVSSIAAHIQFATANAAHTGHNPFADRDAAAAPGRPGPYLRYREVDAGRRPLPGAVVRSGRVRPRSAPPGATADDAGAGRRDVPQRRLRPRPRARRPTPRLPWFVLSAKHGLLDPDEVISPHDVADRRPARRPTAPPGASGWSPSSADRLQLDGVIVEVHGGVDFAQPLRQPLARRGAVLEIPLPGTWRDAGVAPRTGDARRPGAPVRAALDRLRGLVGRHGSAS